MVMGSGLQTNRVARLAHSPFETNVAGYPLRCISGRYLQCDDINLNPTLHYRMKIRLTIKVEQSNHLQPAVAGR